MQQIVVDDFLNQRVADMIAFGKIVSALLGTQTMIEGLACTPTSPASMDVLVAPGQIFFLDAVDTTTYGDLSPTANIFGHSVPANAATIMKQGLILSETTFALTAPSTSGDSVNYLISASYQDQDTEDIVLNYYDSSNPIQPLQGPNNSGTAQPTFRQGKLVLTLTAGTAAVTGTQQTPAVPSGQIGLWVITVAYGQTTITSSSIAVYPGAPFLTQKLFNLMNESGTVNLPAVNASGLITANGGLSVPSGQTATVAGTISVPAATVSNQPVNLGQFPNSLAGSGYQKLPSGLIIQWQAVELPASSATSGSTSFTYPIAFPNRFLSGHAIQNVNVPVIVTLGISSPTTSGANLTWQASSDNLTGGTSCWVMVIGN